MFKKILFCCLFGLAVNAAAETMPTTTPTMGDTQTCAIADVLAGPIFSNGEAKIACAALCDRLGGSWTGNWRTIISGAESVCACQFCH